MPMSPHLSALRAKVGHDLLTLTAASVSIFDEAGRLLLAEEAETGLWMLPGGAIDPCEPPADAAARECWEETGLIVSPDRLIGVFGGPEFLVRYPNGDLCYYTVVAFEARITGGAHIADGTEIRSLRYFTREECDRIAIEPASRVIAMRAFDRHATPFFATNQWKPPA